jgi:tetratricopeptide (TPR) repeat protein
LLLAATILGGLEMRNVAAVDQAMNLSRFEEPLDATSATHLRDAIERLESALSYRPDDAAGQYRAGRLYAQSFRVALGQRMRSDAEFVWDKGLLWDASAPVVLHAHAHRQRNAVRSPHDIPLNQDPLVRQYLQKARDHFLAARRACPTMALVHLRLAEFFFLSDEPAGDVTHLRRAAKSAPSDADVLFQCGLLSFHAGRPGMAFASWKRSLTLTSRHLSEIVRLTRRQLSTEQLITTVVPPLPELLVKLAEDHFAPESLAADRLLIARRAEALLDDDKREHPDLLHLRGRINVLQGRYAEAITDYRAALLLQSHNAKLRYDLARLLAVEGNRPEARRHAEICAYLDPRNQRYVSLLESLSSH